MYAKHLTIRNFRAFKEAALGLCYPDRPVPNGALALRYPNVNLVLGENGAGKSSVFKALTIVILGETLRSGGFRPYYLVRRSVTEEPPSEAVLTAELSIGTAKQTHQDVSVEALVTRKGDYERLEGVDREEKLWEPLYDDRSPEFFVVAYGAGRRSDPDEGYSANSKMRTRSARYQRIESLFDDQVGLTPLSYLWRELSLEKLKEIQGLINSLLPEEVRLLEQTSTEEPLFIVGQAHLPLNALSDGYRGFLSWFADLCFHWNRVAPERTFQDAVGIVLVDEVDLFLHPAWQRTVIPRLAETFPRLQFLFSTHSPIVASSVEAANVFVVSSHNGTTAIQQLQESLHGLSTDDVLTSGYFGLDTPRSEPTEEKLRQLAVEPTENQLGAAMEYLKTVRLGFEKR